MSDEVKFLSLYTVSMKSYQSVFVLLGQQLRLVALHGDLSQPLSHLCQPVQHLHLLLSKQLSVGQRLLQQARPPRAPISELRVTGPHRPHALAQPIAVHRAAERGQRLAEGLEVVDVGFSRGYILLERLGSVCMCVFV